MDYNVNFTWYDKDHKTLIESTPVEVLDVPNQAEATVKIIKAMRKKFSMEDHEGSIRINECNKILSHDDILAQEDGVTPVQEKKQPKKQTKKAKPFFAKGDRLNFDYTTNDFMNVDEFNKTLDTIK